MLSHYLFNKLAQDISPRLEEKKCLNYRQNKTSCSICQDACPVGAVVKKNRLPAFKSSCLGCGICAAACPTRCLSPAAIFWHKIFIDAIPITKTFVGCSRSPGQENMVRVPCLGALPWEMLAALGVTKGKASFAADLSECGSCPEKKGICQFFRSYDRARSFTAGLVNIDLIFSRKQGKYFQAGYSRRDAFRFLGKQLTKMAENTLQELSRNEGKELKPGQILHHVIRLNGKTLLMPKWGVSPYCQGCGTCQSICPQGAWKLEREYGEAKLWHDAKRCTLCSLCLANCPAGALTYELTPGSVKESTRHLAATFNIKACAICKQPLVAPAEKQVLLCIPCKKREKLKKELGGKT